MNAKVLFIFLFILVMHPFYQVNAAKFKTDEKITIDLFQIDIKNVFRIISEISGKNFAIDDDVKGKITLTIKKPASWKRILHLILKMNRLGMTSDGNIIRIATLKTLKEEKAIEKEHVALAPLITEYIPVKYAVAETDVRPHIVITPGRGTLSVDKRNNQIIITDTHEKIRQAKETVRRIDKVTPQVMIEARIVEATDSFSRRIGAILASGGNLIDPAYNDTLGNTGTSYSLAATNPPTSVLGSIGFVFKRASAVPFSIISAQLDASESKGLLTIISSPKIMTLDNKPAAIKQGVKYPLTKLDKDGNTITSFEDIVLELNVTPHVTPDNRISMAISISNNEIGAIINNQTSFTTKEARTELLVNNGDTVIIGGIKKKSKSISDSGFPFLRNIPLIGYLFGSKTNTETKTDLIIFIMPQIVRLGESKKRVEN